MKKFLSVVLSIILMISIMPTGLFNATASAENTVLNIYDAQGLTTGLATANADIVLWNDITYSSSIDVLCNSIDLNGYNLTFQSITLNTSLKNFSIMDQSYNSIDGTSTGELKINGSLNIGNATCVIQSGIVSVTSGIVGSGNLEIQDGTVCVKGTNGSNGTN